MDAEGISALPAPDLLALGCLALPRVAIDATALVELARSAARRAGVKTGRRTKNQWAEIFEAWTRRGLVTGTEAGLAVPSALEGAVLVALSKTPRALGAVRQALRQAKVGSDPVMEARVALYADDARRVREALAKLAESEGLDAVEGLEPEEVVARFGPLDPAALSALPSSAPLLARWVLALATEAGGPLTEATVELLRSAPPDLRALAAMHEILTHGGHRAFLDGLESAPEPYVHEVRALAALAAGDVTACRAAAHDAWRRLPRKMRKPHLDGPLSHLLAFVLATGEEADRDVARTHLTSVKTKTKVSMMLAERLALAHLEGSPLPRPERRPEWGNVVCHVILAVARGESAPDVPSPLLEVCQEHGYTWLVGQLEGLRAWAESPGAPPDGLVFARVLRRREAWELALEGLEAELGPLPEEQATEEEAEGAERLVWWVQLHDDAFGARLSVEPRLQRRNKHGWTRGAAMALRRIYRAPSDAPWIREEDREVVTCLAAAGGWASGGDLLEFTRDVARALVGHPRVAWAHDPDRRVEVVEKAPSVRVVRDEGGGAKLLFHPCSPVGRSPVVEQTGPDTIEVYTLDEKAARIARKIGHGLTLPSEAQARLRPLLARLAPVVVVESDLDPDAVAGREIDPDPRPVLRLGRADGGLKLEVRVAPLGLDGPLLAPGEGGRAIAAKVEGERVRCARDLELEAQMAAWLEAECPTLAAAEAIRGVRVFELADGLEVLHELHGLGDDVIQLWTDDDPLEVLPERSSASFRVTAEGSGQDWLALDGALEIDEERVLDLRSLLERAPSRRGRFVQLDEARFVALSEELASRLELLSAARAETDEVRISPVAAGLVASWEDELGAFDATEEVKARLARAKSARDLKPRTPKTFEGDLRDYQREGYVWLRRLAHWGAGACLADDMGLGKTVQVLALLVARASQGPALVVAPTSVCGNWADEAARFAPTLRVEVLSGAPADLDGLERFDVVVASYGLLALHGEAFATRPFATVVLDEAQAIKNPDTQRAQAAFQLRAEFRIATTGTPVENRLLELWSLMRFLNPGLLGSRPAFERRFAKPIAFDPTGPAMRQLRQIVRPFVLRRTKREVLTELPPRTEIVHEVVPTEDEAAFSEALRREALAELEDAGREAAIEVLAALTRLRQAACAPSLLRPDLDLPSSKLDAFEALLEEIVAGGHRALVFSQFVKFLELARARAEALGLGVRYLDGSTPAAQRRSEVRAFQEGEGEVFFISLKAGGTGLNLTGADYVIHLDPWWNPAVEDQASDRAHRMGQRRPVTIYRLVTKGSIEEKVLALHGEKRDLAERLLDGTDVAAAPDVEALLDLLR